LLYKLIAFLYNKMILEIFKNLFQYLLIKFCPEHYEYKVIKRVNSTGSFVEYSDIDYD